MLTPMSYTGNSMSKFIFFNIQPLTIEMQKAKSSGVHELMSPLFV